MEQTYELSFRHYARRHCGGVTIEGGDGPTVVTPRWVSPVKAGLATAALLSVPPLLWAYTDGTAGPLAVLVFAAGIGGVVAYGNAWSNRRRRPLLVIDHADRVVRLPRDGLTLPFERVRAVHLLIDLSRDRADEASWYFDLGLIAADDAGGERRYPFCTGELALGSRPEASAARLAEELGVPLQQQREPGPGDRIKATLRRWRGG